MQTSRSSRAATDGQTLPGMSIAASRWRRRATTAIVALTAVVGVAGPIAPADAAGKDGIDIADVSLDCLLAGGTNC